MLIIWSEFCKRLTSVIYYLPHYIVQIQREFSYINRILSLLENRFRLVSILRKFLHKNASFIKSRLFQVIERPMKTPGPPKKLTTSDGLSQTLR